MEFEKLNNAAKQIKRMKTEIAELIKGLSSKVEDDVLIKSPEFKEACNDINAALDRLEKLQDVITSKIFLNPDGSGLDMQESYGAMLSHLEKCDEIIDELRKVERITSDTEEYAEAIEKFKKEFISNVEDVISDVSKKALICALNQAVASEDGFTRNKQLLRAELIKSDNSAIFAGLLEKAYYFKATDEEPAEVIAEEIKEETAREEVPVAPFEAPVAEEVDKAPVKDIAPVQAVKEINWQYEKKEFGAKDCVADFFDKTSRGYKLKKQYDRQFHLLNELIFLEIITERNIEELIGKDGVERLYRKGYIARLSGCGLPETVYTYTKKAQKAFLNETMNKVSFLCGIPINKPDLSNEYKTYDGVLMGVILSYAYRAFIIDNFVKEEYEIDDLQVSRGRDYVNIEILRRSVTYVICLHAGMNEADAEKVRERYTVKGNAILRMVRCGLVDGNKLSVEDDYGNGFISEPYSALCFVMEYLTKLFSGIKPQKPVPQPVPKVVEETEKTAEEEEINWVELTEINGEEENSEEPEETAKTSEPENTVEVAEVEEQEIIQDTEELTFTEQKEVIGEQADDCGVKTTVDTRSLGDICGSILENGLNPKENSEEFYTVVRKLIASGKLYEAIFYLGYLRYESEDFAALYDVLRYIAVTPENKLGFSEVQSKVLPEIIGEELTNALQTAMRITQLAFFDVNDSDIFSRNGYVKFADSNLPPALAMPCKALINVLCGLEIKDGGYTAEDVRSANEKQTVTEARKKRADDLLAHPYTKKKSELLAPMLAKDENLLRGLTAVKTNDEKEFEAVKALSLKCYSRQDENGALSVDEKKIAEETDRIWACAREHDIEYKTQPLIGDARVDTEKYIRERAECVNEWLNGLSAAVKPKSQLMAKVLDAARKLANLSANIKADDAAVQVLKFAAKRIAEFLSGKFFDNSAFAFVLGGGEMLLDKDGFPEDMNEFEGRSVLEPWRGATIHFSRPEKSLEELYGEYVKGDDENLTFNNYTFAYLKKALGKEGVPHFTDKDLKKFADEDKKKFQSRTEMEIFYGRVDEDDKEKLFSVETLLYKYYIEERKEYGKYKMFCERLLNSLEELSRKKIKEFESQLDKLRSECADAPILKNIEKAVKERNFYLAEWYVSRLQTGETELTDGELDDGAELGVEKFLNEYDGIYALFKGKKRLSDDQIFSEFKKANKNERAAEVRAYFSNWDLSPSVRPQKIKALVSYFGFDVTGINKEENLKKVKAERYTLTVNPESKTKTHYKIPVSKFGTDCKKITVLYIKDENDVVEAVDEINPRGAATIVLFDGAIAGAMRKNIFLEFKRRHVKENSFLLVDYVLGFYLARFHKNEVLGEFLKCTVPYTGYNFYTDDVAHLPPEMFVGREKEIGIITDFSSSYQLVYGGRQLGKTALLRRAQCIINDVANKQYAFLITLERTEDEVVSLLVAKLSQKLKEFNLIPKTEYTTCKQVLEALDGFLAKSANSDVKIYLMIDESDDFFKQLSESGDDSAMSPFVELRRNRPKQFNFVFAGLHHVVRYESFMKNNSVMGQLGNTLVVKPLSPIEARRLIEIPFSFLGIKIAPEQVAHLATMAIYYPGIVQTICRRIVEQVISNEKSVPPYSVDEKLLEKVCSASDLNEMIRNKLKLTLEIDEKDNTYMPIAMLFSLYTFEDAIPDGFTAERVLKEAKSFGIKSLENLNEEQIRRLLDEMTQMNILRNIKETDSYKLRMAGFAKFIARKKSDAEKYFEGGNS